MRAGLPPFAGMPKRRGRGIAAVVSVLLVATGLVACAPSAPAAPTADSLSVTLAKYGIATVPFAGGKVQHAVTGNTVLALTDWQLEAVAASAPVAKPAKGTTPTPRFVPGIALSGLDLGAAAAAPSGSSADPDVAAITPSALILGWWAHATSARAKLARAGYPAPKSASTVAPFYVLTLFLADAFGDLGRTGADASASGEPGRAGPFALGSGPPAQVDPCAAVAGIVGDVSDFLDNAGTIGTILKGALAGISATIQAAAGIVVQIIKVVLQVADLALNAATLLQQWKVDLTADPASGFSVAYKDNPGVGGTLTLHLHGSLGDLPVPVSSCLTFLGLKNPTDQSGSTVRWDGGYEGYQIGIDPSEIVPPADPPTTLDKNNEAKYRFTTGTETLDADDTETRVDLYPAVDVHVKRADITKLVSWIATLSGAPVGSPIQETFYEIAAQISNYAGEEWGSIFLPVTYWVAKDKTKPDPQVDGNPPPDPGALGAIGNCLAPATVQAITHIPVISRAFGPTLSGVGGPEAKNTCTYGLSNGTAIALVLPYTVDPGAGPGFEKILTSNDGCGVASGYLPPEGAGAPQAVYYLVYSGHSLAVAGWVGNFSDTAKVLPQLARLAQFC